MTLNNGVEIPIFMLGTNIQNKHLLKEVVYAALNEGCRAFDTSPNYQSGAWLGEILQCAMSDLGLKREELFIQTKLDWKDMISNRVEKAFSEMLKTMRLTYVDAYVMHWPQPDTFVESYDFSGKMIVLFATSGGSGITKSAEEIKKLLPKSAKVVDGKMLNYSSEKEIKEWLGRII